LVGFFSGFLGTQLCVFFSEHLLKLHTISQNAANMAENGKKMCFFKKSRLFLNGDFDIFPYIIYRKILEI